MMLQSLKTAGSFRECKSRTVLIIHNGLSDKKEFVSTVKKHLEMADLIVTEKSFQSLNPQEILDYNAVLPILSPTWKEEDPSLKKLKLSLGIS